MKRLIDNVFQRLLLITLCLLLISMPVHAKDAEQVSNVFVEFVLDGDSVELKYPDGKVKRARLLGIDAPEKGQEYAKQSRKQLKYLVEEKFVDVSKYGQDQYGRDLVRIFLDKKDINLYMIEEGLAWAFFLRGQRYPFKDDYLDAQEDAEDDLEGLWLDGDYQAPWEWRKEQRDLREQRNIKEQKQEQWIVTKLKRLWQFIRGFFNTESHSDVSAESTK